MADTRRFRVLRGQSRVPQAERETWPADVPWSFVEPHRERALANHSQTLERLNERGGLAPEELWCLVNDKPLRCIREVTELGAAEWLRGALDAHEARP